MKSIYEYDKEHPPKQYLISEARGCLKKLRIGTHIAEYHYNRILEILGSELLSLIEIKSIKELEEIRDKCISENKQYK